MCVCVCVCTSVHASFLSHPLARWVARSLALYSSSRNSRYSEYMTMNTAEAAEVIPIQAMVFPLRALEMDIYRNEWIAEGGGESRGRNKQQQGCRQENEWGKRNGVCNEHMKNGNRTTDITTTSSTLLFYLLAIDQLSWPLDSANSWDCD